MQYYKYDSQERPIYFFHINRKTKQIERFESTEYNVRSCYLYNMYRIKVTWRASTSYRCIEEPKFDKFLNGYVVTFNPDQNHAMNIMKNETDKQLKKIEKTYKSWKELSSILEDEGSIWNEEKGES